MKQYSKSGLTPAKKAFAVEMAKTDNATQAVKHAFPQSAQTMTEQSLRVKAHRLLTNDNVGREIEYQKNKLEQLASKAVNRVEQLIESDDEKVATTNAWKTIEQVQGTAMRRIETTTTGVTLNIDLTSALALDET